jgi:hypothetical protein
MTLVRKEGMTMRTLFVAVSKVFGLLQVSTGLAYIASMIQLMSVLGHVSSGAGAGVSLETSTGSNLAITVTSGAVMLSITLGVAWIMIFRAEWLASTMNIPQDDGLSSISGDVLLGVGVRILGLFVIVQSAPTFLSHVGQTISEIRTVAAANSAMGEGNYQQTVWVGLWSGLAPSLLKLILGLLLALRTGKVLNRISRADA